MRTHFLISFGILVVLLVGGWLFLRTISQNPLDAITRPAAPDTYGGKTPQETLDLFVAALRAGDVELASKYFVPDDRGSREKWVAYLRDVQAKKLLTAMADDIATKAKPAGSSYEGNFGYEIYNSQGLVSLAIELVSRGLVWKIESL